MDSMLGGIFGIIAPKGYYVALRVGFAFPLIEDNCLPSAWVDRYTIQRFMLFDPVIRWVYTNTGAIRWSEIDLPDPRKVLEQAKEFDLRYGVAVSFMEEDETLRSFGSFGRSDREVSDAEIASLHAALSEAHHAAATREWQREGGLAAPHR